MLQAIRENRQRAPFQGHDRKEARAFVLSASITSLAGRYLFLHRLAASRRPSPFR
jgi:ABC-type branched-subunit amino acid transport system permease subunit